MNKEKLYTNRKRFWKVHIEAALAIIIFGSLLAFLFWLDRKMFPLS